MCRILDKYEAIGEKREKAKSIRRMLNAGIDKKMILEMGYTQEEYDTAMKAETEKV